MSVNRSEELRNDPSDSIVSEREKGRKIRLKEWG